MNENKYCVYIHTNKTNQKRYIGMTKLKPQDRWGNTGNGYRNQEEFYNDIKQYGWDGFDHEVIYSGLSKREAQEKEIELIKEYKTHDSNYGYNKYCKSLRDYQYYTPKEKEKLIHCVELNLTFKTSLAASETTGVDFSSILKACKGIRKSAGKHPDTGEKLHWEFVSIEEKNFC